MSTNSAKYTLKTVIKPKTGWFDINLKEVWQYRDLIWLFTKRNISIQYKQTILGPLWLVLSPLISCVISTFVFGTIAKIPSEGVPYFLFYMAGNTMWSYFATCLTSTSSTFSTNSSIFGKVYFPRLTLPISTVITSLLNFVIQSAMLAGFIIYYICAGADVAPHVEYFVGIPLLILETAMLGLGCGIIISSLTTKYRDLNIVVSFGVSLWMYITPIIYPMSELSEGMKALCMLNPMAPIIETFRYIVLGTGSIPWNYYYVSWIVTLLVISIGVILFSRIEKTFMDTV